VRVTLSALELGGKKYLLGLAEDITSLKNYQQRLEKNLNAIIEAISKIMDTRDPYTSGHQQRVAQLAVRIAQELRLPREQKEAVRIAAALHDIGKIGIPSEILTKPATLNEVEFSLIKKHPEMGYDILKDIDFTYPIAQIVLQHQERMDGSGYPQRLKGKDILLEAKIIGLADVVEAMLSHRPYRPALGLEAALAEISKNKGILYEPRVVEACIRLFREKGFKFKQIKELRDEG
jgi:putative nucleotidyltransferase with HDIG domain